MALYLSRVCTTTPRLFFSITRVLPRLYSKFDVDVMDEFTSQLMQKKMGKWDQKKRKNEALFDNTALKLDDNHCDVMRTESLKPDQLRLLFQNLFDNEDTEGVINLTKLCIASKTAPPVSNLINILTACSQSGEKDIILQLGELCKSNHPEIVEENSNFRHFLAEAVWVKGDISKALTIFEEVYRENAYLRRRIRLMFKYLIGDLVANGSEAALGNMINFSERILHDFQDFLPLTCIWQACFLSEWYSDQEIALELLERHTGLCKSVINRIPYVVFVSLKCHRTEVVYRLLEILLKQKMRPQYSHVVGSLLEYQFRYGDWVRCSEIINWAVDNDVPLSPNCNVQMINLILNKKMKTPLASIEEKLKDQPKYDFKF